MTNLYKIAIWGALCAIAGWWLLSRRFSKNEKNPVITFLAGQPYPSPPLPFVLTEEQVAEYRRDGFLLLRHLVSGEQLAASIRAGERVYHSNTILDWMMRGVSVYAKVRTQTWRTNPEFIQLAFESSFPTISAQLLNETQSIRILKDGFFGQVSTNAGCGFHVDDFSFWPADEESTGVNFWVALSTTLAEQGGGIRVVNQSLLSPETFTKCKEVIRGKQSQQQQPNGNDSKETAAAPAYNSTCSMEQLSPECHEIMMQASVLYDMHPGDVIMWDRWTFHRGEPIYQKNNADAHATADDDQQQHKMRYTIRYIPSHAVAQGMLHPSVPPGQRFDSPLHPQVWPRHRPDEIDRIRAGDVMQDDFQFTWKMATRMVLRKFGWA